MLGNRRIARGIDFDKTTFTEGAVRITGAGAGSGIVFDGGPGGEIYTEPSAAGPAMTLRSGAGGLKIYDSDGTNLLMEISDEGVRIHKSAEQQAPEESAPGSLWRRLRWLMTGR